MKNQGMVKGRQYKPEKVKHEAGCKCPRCTHERRKRGDLIG